MTETPPLKRAHLIANQRSGRGLGAQISQMAQNICDELGVQLFIYPTGSEAEFKSSIKKAVQGALEDGGTVIAAGGDGTIRGVAQEAAGSGVRFGAVAIGTFNFFARTHGLPETAEDALRVALTGTIKQVRLGEVNGHVFLINASVGLYAKSIAEREQSTSRWGRNRVVVIFSTLRSMLNKHRLMSVEFETAGSVRTERTPMIFIGNNFLQLKNLSFDVANCMKQGMLALIYFKPVNRKSVLRILFRAAIGDISKEENVESFCVREITIHSRKKSHNIALDGEMFHVASPLKVQALPQALNLVVAKTPST